jgi:hypothetical protein
MLLLHLIGSCYITDRTASDAVFLIFFSTPPYGSFRYGARYATMTHFSRGGNDCTLRLILATHSQRQIPSRANPRRLWADPPDSASLIRSF